VYRGQSASLLLAYAVSGPKTVGPHATVFQIVPQIPGIPRSEKIFAQVISLQYNTITKIILLLLLCKRKEAQPIKYYAMKTYEGVDE
jgi:hypothetical protein